MNFLLISPPGWGKTTAACSGRLPAMLVDVDCKAAEMNNLKPLIDKGDVVVYPIKERMVQDRLSDRAKNPAKPPQKMPEGYLHTVDLLNDVLDGNPEYDPFKTVILDSATRMKEHMIKLLVYHRGQGAFGKKKEDDMNWPSWGSYLANMVELFDAMKDLQKDFICTVHQKTIEKTTTTMVGTQVIESTEIIGYKPMVDGQFRDQLAGYFNECYYMDAKTSGKNPEYRFRTRGTKYDARTSLPLDEFEKASIEHVLRKGGVW